MIEPPLPPNEAERLAALTRYEILETQREANFDRLTRLAALLFDTPIAAISLMDFSRVWLKSSCGIDITEAPRNFTFCGHAVLSPAPLIVTDPQGDPRFHDNPSVTGDMHLRFYAGAPLLDAAGLCMGVFCVVDRVRRDAPSAEMITALQDLAALVMSEIENRSAHIGVTRAVKQAEVERKVKNESLITISHDMRTPMSLILGMNSLLMEGPLTVAQREHLQVSDRNARDLLRVLDGQLSHENLIGEKWTETNLFEPEGRPEGKDSDEGEPTKLRQKAQPTAGDITHKSQTGTQLRPDLKVLLVEDNQDNILLIQCYLKGQFVILETALNGQEAVQLRRHKSYDLILMDIQMPVMDGHEAMRQIRQWEREQTKDRATIVALTAHAYADAHAQCVEAGCDGFLTKPIERKNFLESIARFTASKPKLAAREIPKGIAAMRPIYLANRRNDIQNMQTALHNGDFEAIRRIAHNCKGTGADYGFPEITALGRSLELAAKEGHGEQVACELNQFALQVAELALAK